MLAAAVLAVFVAGLAAITLLRRGRTAFELRLPRSETALRASDPNRRQLGGVLAGLVAFADAVAEEILPAVWKPHTQ